MIRHRYCESIAQILHRYVHRSWSPLVGVAGDVRDRLVHAQLHITGSTLRQAMLPRDPGDEFSRGADHARTRFCCETQRSSHRRLRDLYPTSQCTKQRRESQAGNRRAGRGALLKWCRHVEPAPPPVRYSPNHKTLERGSILQGVSRAHGRQFDPHEWLLDRLNEFSPIDGPSPRNSVDTVVDDLIALQPIARK